MSGITVERNLKHANGACQYKQQAKWMDGRETTEYEAPSACGALGCNPGDCGTLQQGRLKESKPAHTNGQQEGDAAQNKVLPVPVEKFLSVSAVQGNPSCVPAVR